MSRDREGPGFRLVGDPTDPEAEAGAGALPPIGFGTFVLSISASALVQLGEAPNPETGERLEPNLPLAQQTIDILEMLRRKTEGNLDADEQRLIDGVLHDLRMRFIEARKRAQG